MSAATAAPGQQMRSRSLLVLFAVALVLPHDSSAQGLQRNVSIAPAPAPFIAVATAVPPPPPPPVSTARPPPPPPASPTAVAPSTTATASYVAETPAPSTSPRPSPPPPASPASPSPSPVAAASPPTSSSRSSPPPPPPPSSPTVAAVAPAPSSSTTSSPPPPPATATVAATPPTAAISRTAQVPAPSTSGTSVSPPSPTVTAAPPTVASPPPPSPITATPPSPATVAVTNTATPSAPIQAPAAALQSPPPPASPPIAASASPPSQTTASPTVRQLAGAAPQTAEGASAAGPPTAAAAPTAPAAAFASSTAAAQSPSSTAVQPPAAESRPPITPAAPPAPNPSPPAPSSIAVIAPTPASLYQKTAATPIPAAESPVGQLQSPPTASAAAPLYTNSTPGSLAALAIAVAPLSGLPLAPSFAPSPAKGADFFLPVGPAPAGSRILSVSRDPLALAPSPLAAVVAAAAAVTTTQVRTAAAPAVTGNYSAAGAPTPSGSILAAPAPGSNDAAKLVGQATTTLDAEILVSGNDLVPFNSAKEQAVANSVKAILANYTTVVSVNGATPRGTATAPVSGPGLPPGSTETVTFVPSSAPTPPAGSVSVSVSPSSGRRLLATAQQSVQVNITVTTNTANATAVQDAINTAINNGQLAATLQAAGLDASDVSAVSINVIAVNTPPPPPPPGSPVNTAPAIAPAPKSSTPTGAIVGAVVGGVVGAAALITVLYCCIAARTRKRNRDLEAIQARLSSKESYDSGSSDEAHRLPAFFPGGKATSGLAKIRTGKLGGKSDPLRAESEVLSSSEFSSTDYTDSNEKVLHGSGHIPPTVASSDVTSPGATSVQPGESTDLGSEDTALAALVPGGSDTDGTLLVAGRNRQNVNANLWQILWKDLNVQKQIGEGSFGKVYLAKWRETTVAAKVLLGGTTNSTDEEFPNRDSPLLDGLTKEAGMMASLRHPNVVMYLGVCMEPPCVITEYCARGSLNDVLKRARYVPALAMQLDWPRRLNMCLDAAKGMMYLHSSEPPIIHRDLKSPNLLVDKHWRVKVCDFNLSRVMEETVVLSSMAASNPRWLAPEILSGRGYTYSSDVYSFGIIMWEFLTWRVPWHECGPWQVVALVTEGSARPEIPPIEAQPSKTFPGYEDYVKLMQRCWAQDPEARPDFTQIISALRKLLASEMQNRQKEEKATIMS
ncbi:hypothetical protein WJX74_006734 [Apatococcus lobatus]|uniref:Protein kinase domain-containing protein n=1 Tax=Apatococcus lobatus TaxID=904363 RepID=A0AAW1Q5U7_9CHLO